MAGDGLDSIYLPRARAFCGLCRSYARTQMELLEALNPESEAMKAVDVPVSVHVLDSNRDRAKSQAMRALELTYNALGTGDKRGKVENVLRACEECAYNDPLIQQLLPDSKGEAKS